MNRRAFLAHVAAVTAVTASGAAAQADGPVERILRDLRRLGYRTVSVERTLLRRTRIVAESDEAQREIIVNPNTGEILRDLWLPIGKAATQGASGSLLDDDDDNSGSGSSGSGSGSDNSGSGSDDHNDGDDNSGRGRGRGGDDGSND